MEQSPPIPSSRTRSSSRAGESEKHAQFHALHAKASRTKAAGDLGRAIALYREALDVYESCSHPNPSYLAGALQNLAYTLTEHSLGGRFPVGLEAASYNGGGGFGLQCLCGCFRCCWHARFLLLPNLLLGSVPDSPQTRNRNVP